ncbi:sensor histidine kinase [Nocardiopsis sp. HUAS JQ3]|uniref:sensor histidine kinase n=1 Tax=Nocardiopsis sp. HUAS JQ3 TaxID=3061629 RepID=UPI0023A91722|nr:sensor histidine kinase [Nocardiopsis sp. HUAS JQ3]WDZ92002.1 histidine kinase [Nocardiopsis sp. HUAS JQ3]
MGAVWRRALRASTYLLVVLGSGLVTLAMLPLTLAVALTIPLGGLGFVLLPRWVGLLGRWASWHQRWASRFLGVPVPRVGGREASGFRELWGRPSTRRVLLWLPAFAPTSTVLGLVGLLALAMPLSAPQYLFWWAVPREEPLQLLWLPVLDWGTALVTGVAYAVIGCGLGLGAAVPAARAHARMTLALLAPTEAELLAARVDELSRTRADVVDAHGAELRRIERDLHDGTQARLVAIAMQLGVAREAVENPAVAALLRNAHEGAEEAMAELREVIQGIYPPILADRGLSGALTALAARTTVPTRLDVGELGELPVAVETAAYFVVTESVTNAVKHSGAGEVSVRLERAGGVLRVTVRDDGSGGVDEERGSGVRGLRRRVAALDGTVRVDSPAGGPTVIDVEMPCGS